jgi:superfamily I DNA and/or RNA helicase
MYERRGRWKEGLTMTDTDIEKQLKAARDRLLDLTMRNRLLNFRPTKLRTISIIDEIPQEVYDILVLQEKTMAFRAKPVSQQADVDGETETLALFEGSKQDTENSGEASPSQPWQLLPPTAEVAVRYVDRFLQTELESEELQKRLFYMHQQARSAFEEQGYTILYLALGFLEWMESPNALQPRRAPLILIPVELERTKVSTAFRLRWTGEELFPNLSLQARLSEQGVALPGLEAPEDRAGIDQYLQSVASAVSAMSTWRVVTDIYLDFFSFTKFVMYKDLDPAVWPAERTPADHPLIKAILAPSPDTQYDAGFSEDEVDAKLTTRDVYHVMDADPSQIAVIEDARRGLNMVVEGPPGTGKSQTITNIIAELLAAGKSVLFVSEKMAALEVVKSRLDRVGLGDFCLELHSCKSNKKEVLKELERTISVPAPRMASYEDAFIQVERLKAELNDYAKALREPCGRSQRSPFALFCIRETARRHFAKGGRPMPQVHFANPEQYDQQAWSAAVTRLHSLAEALPLVLPLSKHPWRGCNPGTVLPRDEAEIRTLIRVCQEAVHGLEDAIDRLVTICAIQRPTTLETLPHALTAARVMAMSKPVDRQVLLNTEWNRPSEEAEKLVRIVETFQNERIRARAKFAAKALDCDIALLLEEYKLLSAKFLRFFKSRYRYIKREIASLYTGKAPRRTDQIVADLEQLILCIKLRDEARKLDQTGRAFFGSHWQAEESDPDRLRTFAAWIVSFRKQLLAEVLTERAVDMVSAGVSQEQVEHAVDEVKTAMQRFVEQRDLLISRINANYQAIFGGEADTVPFAEMLSRLELWDAALPRLQRWAQFVARREACRTTIAQSVVETVEEDRLDPEDVLPCFEGNLADALLHLVFVERLCLAHFVGELHERKIQRFSTLDRDSILWNRQRLIYKLHQNRPRLAGGASPGSEAGILLGELSRKRGHMPIRKLLAHAGGLIQRIKPCFMMSPLSIAQFCDPRTARFDAIVFDEASQVRPEDALGALLRGSQVIVIGDTRQLPPTSFFDRIIETSDEDEDELIASVATVESILHQCKRSFPTKTLRWHYRSKHESLIAVANQEFYDNRLLIYPSPIDKAEHLGVQFVHLPHAIYDRGRSSVNREEATAVAQAALDHYRQFPDKSLGVGTFNIKQQQAILEEVELQLRLHPEMEDFFVTTREEHFFVKNLETIQGDERDVIFLSVGFGLDQFGRLSRNFGPLNHEGGERRLNVLITRARERCVVFSNFRASDLALDASAPIGLRALKIFLEYAESRQLHHTEAPGEDTDSPFEDAVYDCLRSNGYEVRKQVGCAGFRVDLAVVDPASPGRYLLGIECDGAKYHSSPVARDRDRLRQQILEGLGWRIHRIWSTDWYRNRSESESRLLDAVERANEERTSAPIVQAPQPPRTTSGPSHAIENVQAARPSISDNTLHNMVPDYRLCSSLGIPVQGELHDQPSHRLAEAVTQVVEIEGPVHIDEVVRRIRSLWGLRRSGKRIAEAIHRAALAAEKKGQIRRRHDFLWPAVDRAVPVRRRSGEPPANIDLICDEEIATAVKLVLKLQHATLPQDLITQTSRLLGIKAISSAVAERIRTLLDTLVQRGELQHIPNGMIHLAAS